MPQVPQDDSSKTLQSKDHFILDLSCLVEEDQEMDCDLPEEDFLQQLSNDLEIPMLLEESLQSHSDRELDSLIEASTFFKEFDDWDWGADPSQHNAPELMPQVSVIKEEIKLEEYKFEEDLSASSSTNSQDSWPSSVMHQNILETPPISPPQSSSGSPPRTPTPPSSQEMILPRTPTPPTIPPPRTKEPPVLMVGGKPIKIVPLKQSNGLGENRTKMVVLQPRPVSVAPLTLPHAAATAGQKTLVLRPKDLSVLTKQVNAKQAAPAEIRIVNPINIKREVMPERQDVQMKALKRQQRMIKNRESACLSRKKKKEYITSLEYKISELEKENIQLKVENESLRARLGHYEGESPTKRPQSMFSVNIKKTAVLAVLLVVSINLGSISILSRGRMGADSVMSVPEMPLSRQSGRKLLWTDADLQNVSTDTQSQYNPHPTCPLHINQTESLRLNSELRRWIAADKPSYSNKSVKEAASDLVDLQPTQGQLMLRQTAPVFSRHRRKIKMPKREVQELEVVGVGMGPHADLLHAIRRRDDTFYLVSFSGDHLLLPALAHNSSVRPKMSLVLPALPFNASMDASSSSVTMMQIDCEVLDTKLVEVNERDIPANLKQARPPTTRQQHKNVSDEEEPVRNAYRPYFVRPNAYVDPYSASQRGPH